MNRFTLTTMTCLVLAASSALAQDIDADTRFHRAYEQEVVEGKVADAARVYLEMLRDEKVPERLRAEAKFRFAVTAILLGRADEGRAYFGELVHDAKTSETLRARSAEYLDAAKGIGVGSELDKKLQSLVFDLARITPGDLANMGVPAPYRDFEVIGRQAIPFLRQLLQHTDPALRRNAYRLLLRMREPGMASRWTPELHHQGVVYGRELADYLMEVPGELAAFEERLLALDDKGLSWTLGGTNPTPKVSATFLRSVAARAVGVSNVVRWLEANAFRDEDLRVLRSEWMRSENAELAAAATRSFLSSSVTNVQTPVVPQEIFPVVVASLSRTELGWPPLAGWHTIAPNTRQGDSAPYQGFRTFAAGVSTSALLDAFETSLDRSAATRTVDPPVPSAWPVLDALAFAVEDAKPSAEETIRYVGLVRRWVELASARGGEAWFEAVKPHVGTLLLTLPMPQATEFAGWLFDVPDRVAAFGRSLPRGHVRRIVLLLPAYRKADVQLRRSILESFGIGQTNMFQGEGVEYAREILAALPELVRRAIAERERIPDLTNFVNYATQLPSADAVERLVAVLEALAEHPDVAVGPVALSLLDGASRTPDAYQSDVVLPALERVWPRLAQPDRTLLYEHILAWFAADGSDDGLRRTIAAFVLGHLDDVPINLVHLLSRDPALLPPAKWVPRVNHLGWSDHKIHIAPEAADAIVREATRDPATTTDSMLEFAMTHASKDLRVETLARLLRTAPAERLDVHVRWAVWQSNGRDPAILDALEAVLARLVAGERPDLDVVGRIVTSLAKNRPSERIFPAVRLLLASPRTGHLLTAFATASSLGREELLPALAGALDSMDPDIRQKAREAIDAIVELRKLREEARRNAADPPK